MLELKQSQNATKVEIKGLHFPHISLPEDTDCTSSTTVCKQSAAGLWCSSRTNSKLIMRHEFFTNPRGGEGRQTLHNILKCEHCDKTKNINTFTKV